MPMSACARFVPGNPHAWSPIDKRDTPHYQSLMCIKCIGATIDSPHAAGAATIHDEYTTRIALVTSSSKDTLLDTLR